MWMGNVKAQEIVPTMIEGVKSLLGKGTDPTWFERMKDVGVIKSNFFTADFTDELTAFEKLTKGELQLKVDNILSLSRKFGGAIENISRAGMWIDGVKKGMDDRQAAQRVFKYLFNYEELTDFERNYLRRVIPFYTWTRKSVPMLVESALTNPNKLNTTLKAYDSIQHIVDLQEDDIKNLPDWMKKFGTFMLPWKDSKGNNLWASIDLPVGTLEKVAGKDIAGLFSGKTPFMDLWLVANNVKSFPTFGEKVEKFPGELTKAPFWAGWMPQPLMQALGIQPMKDRETRKMVLGWTKKTEQAVYAALPGLKEITNMIPGGGVDVEEEDATWRTMSYFTGVNLRPIDEREQMFYRRLKTKEAKAAYAKKIHQLGRRPTEEEREAYQQMIAKLR
jgi:hypothetical protein